jgi:outer membrane protein
MNIKSKNKILSLVVALTVMTTGLGAAQAADTSMGFQAAITQAFKTSPELTISRTNWQNAQADLTAKQSDPGVLVVALTQSQHAFILAKTSLNAKKIEVAYNVTSAFLDLYEQQQEINLLNSQLILDSQTLEAAKVRLSTKNGTTLDVAKAQNALTESQQTLTNAKTGLPILSNKLETLLGMNLSGNLLVSAPVLPKEIKIDLSVLEKNLDDRLPNLVQSGQNVIMAQLNVKLSDNEFTPAVNLREAKKELDNAQRSWGVAMSNALTGLRDAARGVVNAQEKLKIAKQNFDNTQESFQQDQDKWKAGLISKIDLQKSELLTLKARYNLLLASDNCLRARMQFSVISGQDQTGLLSDLL